MSTQTKISNYSNMSTPNVLMEYDGAKNFEPEGVNDADRNAAKLNNEKRLEALELVLVDRGLVSYEGGPPPASDSIPETELTSERAVAYLKTLKVFESTEMHDLKEMLNNE